MKLFVISAQVDKGAWRIDSEPGIEYPSREHAIAKCEAVAGEALHWEKFETKLRRYCVGKTGGTPQKPPPF